MCFTCVLLGASVFIAPNPQFGQYVLFQSDYSINFIILKWCAGPLFMLFGIYYFYRAIKRKPINLIYFNCKSCGSILKLNDAFDHECSSCGTKLEKLEDSLV